MPISHTVRSRQRR